MQFCKGRCIFRIESNQFKRVQEKPIGTDRSVVTGRCMIGRCAGIVYGMGMKGEQAQLVSLKKILFNLK